MANVKHVASDYSGVYSILNGSRLVKITPLDFIRSIITVGAQDFGDLYKHGVRSMGHHIASAINALVLIENKSGDLAVSSLYRGMDSTEIGVASYRFGMALTKFAAERELKVPWLAHVDKLYKSGVLKLTAGTVERGDLAGMDASGNWHVFESKGRSSPPGNAVITKAKRQASRIASINGSAPATRSACIVHLYDVPIRIDLVDPDESDVKTEWDITIDEYFRAYYRRILQIIETQGLITETILGNEFDIASFGGFGASIQLGILSAIRANPEAAREKLNASLSRFSIEQLSTDEISIGSDGIILRILGGLAIDLHGKERSE